MLPPPLRQDVGDPLPNLHGVPRTQGECRAHDDHPPRQVELPVREVQRAFIPPRQLALSVHQCGLLDDFPNLAPVGAGIHHNRPSHASGDTGAELQAGETVPGGDTDQLGNGHAGFDAGQRTALPVPLPDGALQAAHGDDDAPIAPVPDDQVGPVADRDVGHAAAPAMRDDPPERLDTARRHQCIGPAPDPEGGVAVQGFVEKNRSFDRRRQFIPKSLARHYLFCPKKSPFFYALPRGRPDSPARLKNSSPIFHTLPAPWVTITSEGFAIASR